MFQTTNQQFVLEQFHPFLSFFSISAVLFGVSNLGPGPMRYLLTSGIDNLPEMEMMRGTVGRHALSRWQKHDEDHVQSLLLDKKSEQLDLDVRTHMMFCIHENMCQNM